MLEILCFDFCAVVILLILLFTLVFCRSISDVAGRRLLGLVITMIFAAFFDMAANAHNGISGFKHFNYLCSGCYHILRNVSFYLYARYIISVARTGHNSENRLKNVVKYIPIAVTVFTAVTAPRLKIFYYYDNTATYIRGTGYALVYVCSALYAVYAFLFILKNISIVGYRKSVSLASCAVLSLCTSVIQFKYPYLVVDILGFAISLLCITLFIDNPEEKLDTASLLMRRQVYISDVKMAFFTSRSFDIIHISIKNIREIEYMLSFRMYIEFIRMISSIIRTANTQRGFNGDMYYLRDGAFRVVLYDNDEARTYKMAEELCEALNGELKLHEIDIHVDTAITVTQCPQDFDNADDLLGFAKAALYLEKVGEVLPTKDMLLDETSNLRSNIDKYIERGIMDGGFKVFYHPIYSVKDNKYSILEASLRLLDKQKGVISPELFLPVAEQNGAIIELGAFVLEDVCRLISDEEFEKTGVERVIINLSVVQCLQNNLADQVISTMKKYNVAPEMIMVSITESLASDNHSAFDENVRKLTEFGIEIALNKFGDGYSNMATLTKVPVKTVMFDKMFAEFDHNEKLQMILENTVDMIKSLGKEIFICGISDDTTADKCISLGFDGIQGEINSVRAMPENMLCVFYDSLNVQN